MIAKGASLYSFIPQSRRWSQRFRRSRHIYQLHRKPPKKLAGEGGLHRFACANSLAHLKHVGLAHALWVQQSASDQNARNRP